MKIKSYIAKFNEPTPDGTLFLNGCMDQQLGDKIPVYSDGFRDEKVLDGYAILCKDENGYFVECDISDTEIMVAIK